MVNIINKFCFCVFFRSEMTNETDRLTTLATLWEAKVEDESIPEESECILLNMRLYLAVFLIGKMTVFPNKTVVIQCLISLLSV